MAHSEYLILKYNSYDGPSIHYCDSKEELASALRSKDFMHYSFPLQDVEVYEVARELTSKELLDIREGKTQMTKLEELKAAHDAAWAALDDAYAAYDAARVAACKTAWDSAAAAARDAARAAHVAAADAAWDARDAYRNELNKTQEENTGEMQ